MVRKFKNNIIGYLAIALAAGVGSGAVVDYLSCRALSIYNFQYKEYEVEYTEKLLENKMKLEADDVSLELYDAKDEVSFKSARFENQSLEKAIVEIDGKKIELDFTKNYSYGSVEELQNRAYWVKLNELYNDARAKYRKDLESSITKTAIEVFR